MVGFGYDDNVIYEEVFFGSKSYQFEGKKLTFQIQSVIQVL